MQRVKYDSPSLGIGKSFKAFSSGEQPISKIFVIIVQSDKGRGPGMTGRAGLTSTAFPAASAVWSNPCCLYWPFPGASVFGFSSGFISAECGGGFSTVAFPAVSAARRFLASASIFSVGAAVFGCLGFFCRRGRWFYLGWLFKRFRDISGFLPSASSFSRDETAFGFSSVSSPPAWRGFDQWPCLAISVA